MKKSLFVVFIALIVCFGFASCRNMNAPVSGETTGRTEEPTTPATTLPDDSPEPSKPDAVQADIILFMGGSNMAGRGNAEAGVNCPDGYAYEFRAVSDPTRLYPMSQAFGKLENQKYGIDDGVAKTGSMVPAFCKAYYEKTNTPVIAVSASEGNTSMQDWMAGKGRLEDAIDRLDAAKAFVSQSDSFAVRHIYMVWCQGEADAEAGSTAADYLERMNTLLRNLKRRGVENCFIIQTGTDIAKPMQYQAIREAQAELCKTDSATVLVSDLFADLIDLKANGTYTQPAYDRVGAEAGANAADYVLDPENYTFSGDALDIPEQDQFDGSEIELPIDSWKRKKT